MKHICVPAIISDGKKPQPQQHPFLLLHQGHVPPPLGKDLPFSAPPFQLSGTVTFLTIPCCWNHAGTRALMAQRSLNMASSAPKTLGPGILTASSPNINLSTNMASEAISKYLILKIFMGEHAPRSP